MQDIAEIFPKGILRPELYMGEVYSINANEIQVNFSSANAPSGSYYMGNRYGKGEVGEFVIIEGQINLILGRVTEVWKEDSNPRKKHSDAFGKIRMLGSISMDSLRVITGIQAYPRLGDRIYAAPKKFVSLIPSLMDTNNEDSITLSLGSVDTFFENKVNIRPENLFGRHCAILGSTGGGKSWTISRIIEENLCFESKVILLDATGEYRSIKKDNYEIHLHLANPQKIAKNSEKCSFSPTCFTESDFTALFEPSGKVQGPKLREALKSLRLAYYYPQQFQNGYIQKIEQNRELYDQLLEESGTYEKINDPSAPFDITKLTEQIEQECVQIQNSINSTMWGRSDGNFHHCLPLISRINIIMSSYAFECVFKDKSLSPLTDKIDEFLKNQEKKLLRLDLSGISSEYKAREIITNSIGRYLLNKARNNEFITSPLLIIIDEAHNFLGEHIGKEEIISRLDAFELIAKEGRKYGLNICLATQRPRDITEGVLSQMGTMIVHRLTNDRDREVVERACGELDRDASSFIPNLKPGEAVIIGCDLPIPLTIQIKAPNNPPESTGPNYQKSWTKNEIKSDS